jgi:hypothetical protein
VNWVWRAIGCRRPAGVPEADKAEARRIMVDLALSQVEGQIASSDSWDSKAIGILTIDGVLIAVVASTAADWGPIWWLPIVGGVISTAAAVWTIWPRTFVRPDIQDLNAKHGGEPLVKFSHQVIAELLARKADNAKPLKSKRIGFEVSTGLLALTLIASGLSFLVWR